MIVGLLFAIAEAEDRPGVLAATLPFGASTLLEYQARLLQDAGATHLILVVQRLTPDLLAATARLARRGMTVDTARGAADVLARAHPLSRVVMLADGLVTTGDVVSAFAEMGAEALLTVTQEATGAGGLERLGGGVRWGGVARLEHARLADAAAMPADYDLQSTLLRAAEQAGARHVPLTEAERRLGHGVERRADMLEARGRVMLTGAIALGSGWFERHVVRPLARRSIPLLARHRVRSGRAAIAGGAVMATGLVLMALGHLATGVLPLLLGVVALEIVAVLAIFRDERALGRSCVAAGQLATAAGVILVARAQGDAVAFVLAGAGLINAALAEHAARGVRRRRWWWMSPGAALAVLAASALAGQPLAALALVAIYATVTLGAAVDALRRDA